MYIASNIIVGIVALLHTYFLVLEMFLWDKPLGLKVFQQTKKSAEATKILAANQGLYNGFLAAGLIWGIVLAEKGIDIKLFFLSCVVVAGIYGAVTVGRKIFFIQALPAIIAVVLVLLT